MGILDGLRASHEAYCNRLLARPQCKSDAPEIPASLAVQQIGEIAGALRQLTDTVRTPFELYSVGRHAFALLAPAQCVGLVRGLIPAWLDGCVTVGAYEAGIRFAKTSLSAPGEDLRSSHEGWCVLLSMAKAFRNIGDFDRALSAYREALSVAQSLELDTEKAVTLMLIGKLRGNYLGQRSLFSCFVEEAKERLAKSLRCCATEGDKLRNERAIAMCSDALGQVYRDSDQSVAARHFKRAIRANAKMGRTNGLSRAVCHLSAMAFESRTDERPYYLAMFEKGCDLLWQDPMEERGRGIRWFQYAQMLYNLGRPVEAAEALDRGRQVAQRYSDYRTLIRGLIIKADAKRACDSDAALRALMEGQEMARERKLLLDEAKINRRLADLAAERAKGDPAALLERNTEILTRLIRGVVDALSGGAEHSEPEFALLSARRRFRENLLLDHEHINSQFASNMRTATRSLRIKEDRQKEVLIGWVMNSNARGALHCAKGLLMLRKDEKPLSRVADTLDALAEDPRRGTTERDALRDCAHTVRNSDKTLKQLEGYLTRHVQRPGPGRWGETVDLAEAAKQALSDMWVAGASTAITIRERVRLFHANGDAVALALQNLIQNAVQATKEWPGVEPFVEVGVASEPTGTYGNPSRRGVLVVLNRTTSLEAAEALSTSIRKGLNRAGQPRPGSTGFGMESVEMIFRQLMAADVEVSAPKPCGDGGGYQVGVQIGFSKDFEIAPSEPK